MEKPEPYVFDLPEDTTANFNEAPVSEPELNVEYYLVQIGAFTTKDKAEKFASDNKSKIKKEIQISYNEQVNLFVVQLSPLFTEKKEAEKLRNELWKDPAFKDAWILTVTK